MWLSSFSPRNSRAHVFNNLGSFPLAFRQFLFSRIVPCVKDIGLWGPKVQQAYVDLGVIDAAGSDLDALMRDDEDTADRLEQEHAAELAARKEEVDAAITSGGT